MSIKTVDAQMLKGWLEQNEAVLVDVREPAEHASEKIEGALLLPLAQVCAQALPQHAGKKLVIYCRSGMRSHNACQRLCLEDPSLEVYNLEGGINAWAAAGQSV
ncbi:MAG: rhodanese-like domain-containing protein [Gammaproteobacteria bacterium]|nr:rhodanese-like domain-containing protein [Gammaproteobacteria bacterium]